MINNKIGKLFSIFLFLSIFYGSALQASKIVDESCDDLLKSERTSVCGFSKNDILTKNIEEKYVEAEQYFTGNGKPISYSKAFECFLIAANLGHSKAQFDVGILYEGGLGCKQSLEKAKEYMQKADKNDYKEAKKELLRIQKKIDSQSKCLIF